jgi:hypothetical protein
MAMLIALCAGGAGIAWNSIANKDRAALRTASRDRAALLEEKRQAYNWILQNTAPDARVVAGEDAALYLYTGRQAIAHIALRRSGAYEEAYLQEDLAHITDVAKAIGAQYWVGSSDDSEKQWVSAKAPLAARFKEVEDVLPEVFRSNSGRVRIYSLGCVQHPEAPSCEHAAHILFPQDR